MNTHTLSVDERALLEWFRILAPEVRAALLLVAQGCAEQAKASRA